MLKDNKIWQIQNIERTYTDEELISLIQNGTFNGDIKITNKDLKQWYSIADTIYQFYLPQNQK